jgi:hypothetical protein
MLQEELELSLPKNGDKIFIENEGSNYDYASINRAKGINNQHSEFLIIEGYREATRELLINLLKDENISWLKIDSKIYPILFLFRHYIEVMLKNTVRYYNILNDKSFSDEVGYEKKHSLLYFWNELKPFLVSDLDNYDESYKQDCLNTNQAVESIISEIDVLDESSFGFRYAFKGAKKINEPIEYSMSFLTIDLNNLKDVMTKVMNYFEGINGEVIHFLDEKQSNAY